MTTSVQNDWTNRVLIDGNLGLESPDPWIAEAYNHYREKLQNPQYPCFFGQAGEVRGEMLYTFIPSSSNDSLLRSMRAFIPLLEIPEYQRCSLVAFFEPDPNLTTHTEFVERFWGALQFLHNHETSSKDSRTPDDPLWEFSFSGCEMFVVGASPTYMKRRSRNLGHGMVLIFQPRFLFIDPATLKPIAATVRHRIHKRMLAYDGMPVHPDIGFYGNPANREWKQYALPDDNEIEQGVCPFHA